MSEWQAMETAPTHRGARILGWCVYPLGAEARIVKNTPPYFSEPDAIRWEYQGIEQAVTHWMPLPGPPQ